MGLVERCLQSSESESHSVKLLTDCVSRGKKSRRRLRKVTFHTFLRKFLKDVLQNNKGVNAENRGKQHPQSDAGREQPRVPPPSRAVCDLGRHHPIQQLTRFFFSLQFLWRTQKCHSSYISELTCDLSHRRSPTQDNNPDGWFLSTKQLRMQSKINDDPFGVTRSHSFSLLLDGEREGGESEQNRS